MTEIDSVGAVTAPLGFSAGATTAGIKESGLPDLALLASDRPASAVGMFTSNQTQAAPLSVSRRHLENGLLRGMIVNSGNANCATGSRGVADAETMTELAAALIGCAADEVFVNSTGIIGHFLPIELLHAGVPTVELQPDGGADFARAIMTTDTFPKEALATFEANGQTYRIGGCAKGAGMIHPNMATMIALVTTDAPIEHRRARRALPLRDRPLDQHGHRRWRHLDQRHGPDPRQRRRRRPGDQRDRSRGASPRSTRRSPRSARRWPG